VFQAKRTTICLKCGVHKDVHFKRCKPSLWGNKPKFYTFHSEGESQRYVNLLVIQVLGAISRLHIQENFRLRRGRYVADFVYYDRRARSFWYPFGRWVIEDYKGGYQTETFQRKWKEMQSRYPQYIYRLSDKPSGLILNGE
jgi:hypothetical protein